MKKSFVRLLALIMSCLLISTMISSCALFVITDELSGDVCTTRATAVITTREITIPETPAAEKEQYVFDPVSALSILQDRNYNGEYFNIITFGDEKLFSTSEDDFFSRYSYEITKAIEKKFSLSLVQNISEPEKIIQQIAKDRDSGGYYADLLILPYSMLETLKENGFITSYERKALYDPDYPYFDQVITEEMRTGDGLTYALYTPAFYDPRDSYCIFFNKNSADAQSLYSDVLSGGWTVESFNKAVSGKKIVYDEGFSEYEAMLNSSGGDAAVSYDPTDAFSEGGADFMITRISDIEKLTEMSDPFGILPLPKDSAEDDYYSYCGAISDVPVFMCPDKPTSFESTMLVINAISAAAGDVYAHYAKEHYTEYVRDNTSVSMLGYIFSPMKLYKAVEAVGRE